MEADRFRPEGPPDPLPQEEMRTCRIERWRGYVTSRFLVVGEEGPILESKAFRWSRAAPPPETASARAAYDGLVARLEAEGWTFLAAGATWFGTTFARTAVVSRPAAAPVEPEHVPDPVVAVQPPVPAPEPEPAAEPSLQHELEPTRRPDSPRWRRPGSLLLTIGVGALAAGATVFAVHSASAGSGVVHPKARRPAVHAVPHTRPSQKPVRKVAKPAAAPRLARVTFVAHGNGSWIEARLGSSAGKLLYSGTLEPGRRLHLSEPRVWAELGAAGNLSISSNGKPVVLRGTLAELFQPTTR